MRKRRTRMKKSSQMKALSCILFQFPSPKQRIAETQCWASLLLSAWSEWFSKPPGSAKSRYKTYWLLYWGCSRNGFKTWRHFATARRTMNCRGRPRNLSINISWQWSQIFELLPCTSPSSTQRPEAHTRRLLEFCPWRNRYQRNTTRRLGASLMESKRPLTSSMTLKSCQPIEELKKTSSRWCQSWWLRETKLANRYTLASQTWKSF